MRPRLISAVISATVASLSLIGCGGGAGDGTSGEDKEVVVDGSSTVFRISRAAMEGYHKVNPSVNVVVNNHGTGGGFGKYIQGEVDVVDASRPAKAEEEAEAKAAGMTPWTRFVVGYDGITIVVSAKNDFVKSLSVGQLKALFQPGSKVRTWKDLDPSWPDRKITLYSPDKDSGTFEFFTEAITGKAKSQRKGVQQSPDDNILVTGVAGDADGLGYFGYAYFAANSTKLRAVPIQDGDSAKPVMPSPETILDKTYRPLSRPLFIYVKNAAMARPEVSGFVAYYLENVATLSRAGGYVAPTAADVAANKKALGAVGASSKVATGR